MNIEEFEVKYEELRQENENLRYHMGLILMMLPNENKYDFFHYSITMNLSRVETAKILKILMKINAKLKKREIVNDMYTVQHESISFDTNIPIEQFGKQFQHCLHQIFPLERNINPIALLKACKAQALYIDACDLLLEQIENTKDV